MTDTTAQQFDDHEKWLSRRASGKADVAGLQSTTQQSKQTTMTIKNQRKHDRRVARRTVRIAENPALALTTQIIFKRYDQDENQTLDTNEVYTMILDLQRNVEDHVKVTEDSAMAAAKLLIGALDRDNNNEVDLEELTDWIIRKSEKLDPATRNRIMAMHDAGDDSETVERQVVLVRLLNAVEEISEHLQNGCVVAVFGKGMLGLEITDSGCVLSPFLEPTFEQKARAAVCKSGDIVSGMEIIQVGNIKINHAKEIVRTLKASPRPIQIVFQHPSDIKHEAATKLQRVQSKRVAHQTQVEEARNKMHEVRVKKYAMELFRKYDLDGNAHLDAEELKHLLLDTIVSWTGVVDGDDEGDGDNITDIDMDKELKLAYTAAHLLVEKNGTVWTEGDEGEEGDGGMHTVCDVEDGELGMKIACIDQLNDQGDILSTAAHITEVTPGSQADRHRLKPGNIIVEIGGHIIKGKEYSDIVKLFLSLPRPFPLKLLRQMEHEKVLSVLEFSNWVYRTSEKWKTPSEAMSKARMNNRIGSFLIEVANAITATADIQRGGKQIAVLFRSPIGVDLGLEVSSEGYVTKAEHEARELGVEVGMVLLKIGQKDLNCGVRFHSLIDVAHRPVRVVFRRVSTEENKAASKMQAVQRGRSERKLHETRLSTRREEINLERHNQREEEDKAATIVQSYARRKVAKEEYVQKVKERTVGTMVQSLLVHSEGGDYRNGAGGPVGGGKRKSPNPRYKRTLETRINVLTDAIAAWMEWADGNDGAKGPPLHTWSTSLIEATPRYGSSSGSLLRAHLSFLFAKQEESYRNVLHRVCTIQQWVRSVQQGARFLQVVQRAAAIKLQKMVTNRQHRKHGQELLAKKKQEAKTNQAILEAQQKRAAEEIQKEDQKNTSNNRNNNNYNNNRRRRRERRRNQQNNSSVPAAISSPSTSVLPPLTNDNDSTMSFDQFIAHFVERGPRKAVINLYNSNLFLNIEIRDLLPLLQVAPAHQQAVVRDVMSRANDGDTSSLRDLILDACDEATNPPTSRQGYDEWGQGQSYNMGSARQRQRPQYNPMMMQQMVPASNGYYGNGGYGGYGGMQQGGMQQGGMQQGGMQQGGMGMIPNSAGGPPVRFVPMQPMQPMVQPYQMVQQQMIQQQQQYQNSPRLKNVRPGQQILNSMDPGKFSGVVVFEKGKPVEAHIDEVGQKPVWDEVWGNFNDSKGV